MNLFGVLVSEIENVVKPPLLSAMIEPSMSPRPQHEIRGDAERRTTCVKYMFTLFWQQLVSSSLTVLFAAELLGATGVLAHG